MQDGDNQHFDNTPYITQQDGRWNANKPLATLDP